MVLEVPKMLSSPLFHNWLLSWSKQKISKKHQNNRSPKSTNFIFFMTLFGTLCTLYTGYPQFDVAENILHTVNNQGK